MNEKIKKFISHVTIDIISNKGSLKLIQKKRLNLISGGTKIKVSGYFDESDGLTLAVAIKKAQKIWLQNLVHEYSHFCQWKEQDPIYVDCDGVKGMNHYDLWLSGDDNLTKEELLKCTRALQYMELDCEKRAVKWIEEFNLPLNKEDYIKRANTYVLFYEIVRRNRKWYGKIAPYESKDVLNSVKPTWYTDKQYTTPTKEFERLVIKNCFDT